jgi:hypothetical protein
MMLGALVLVGVLVFMSGTAISSAGQQKLSESVQKILLNYLQVVTMARSFPLRWPQALEGLFDFQGAFSTVGDHLVNPDCVSDTATAAELVYNKQAVFAFMPDHSRCGLCLLVRIRQYDWRAILSETRQT